MNDQEAIENVLTTYFAAANAGDAVALAALYTEDAVLLPGDMPTAEGVADIEALYAGAFSQLQLDIEVDLASADIVVDDDLAYATTTSAGTRRIHATGDTIPENNRELWIMARAQEGWKITRYMFNKSDTMR